MRAWLAAAFLALAPIAGCATTATISQAPIGEGIPRDYEASFETVREATRETLQRDMPVTLTGAEEREGAYIFNFEVTLNAFNWGEVGRVVVMPVDADTTRVIVRAEKRSQMQVTGHGERELAERLFANLDRRLR